MLDALQAATVAYLTDGGVIHDICLPDEVLEKAEQAALDAGSPRGSGWRVFDEAIREEGYDALSRFSIGEWESSQWDDLAYRGIPGFPEELSDYGDTVNVDYQDETVLIDGEWHDVSMYIAVICDNCHERIS